MLFDIEGDSLNPTKIHVLSYTQGGLIQSTHDYDEMREVLLGAETLVGHNIILFDIPVIERILGIKIKARLIDTLALSWTLYPNRIIHGLESWGEEFGVPKPKIDDWENLSQEEYRHRCEEDVKITKQLYYQITHKLNQLYGSHEAYDRYIKYITFKMECAREQERSKWKLDVERVQKNIDMLEAQQQEKIEQLSAVMPEVPKFVMKSRPLKPFKKDGSYSVTGAKWFKLLRDNGLPNDYDGEVQILHSKCVGNPNSHQQVKDWLFSLGWKPMEFKFVREDDGSERQIPQVRVDGEDGKQLCESVLELIDDNPELAILEGLTVIQHRLGIFKGFMRDQENGWIKAQINGFTNTLRFKHKTIVNLPGVDKPLGEEVRGCLIAPEGYELCGSDMVSLEDTTKRHYMYFHDPEYVEEMSKPGYDPHLDLAKFAKFVTQQMIDDWQNKKEGAKDLKPIRKNFKVTNYSATYGVKPPKLSRTAKIPVAEAKKLLDAFWKRNWAIEAVANETEVKYLKDEMWLYNPVSKFWYSLRHKKDIFSTLNQGTGVFCFDTWLMKVRQKRKQMTGQFHDEGIWTIKTGHREQMEDILKTSIQEVNDKLQLNVKLDVDVQFGINYAEIH